MERSRPRNDSLESFRKRYVRLLGRGETITNNRQAKRRGRQGNCEIKSRPQKIGRSLEGKHKQGRKEIRKQLKREDHPRKQWHQRRKNEHLVELHGRLN